MNMAGKRGRQKQSPETVKSAFFSLKNKVQLDDALQIMVDGSTGRATVFVSDGAGGFDTLISVSGNTLVDIVKGAKILLKYAHANYLADEPLGPADKVDDSDQA
jgi:hypothetical protein